MLIVMVAFILLWYRCKYVGLFTSERIVAVSNIEVNLSVDTGGVGERGIRV